MKKRLVAYAGQHPDQCRQIDTDPETGCMEFEIRKGRFSFHLTAPYNEERREAARQYARDMGTGFAMASVIWEIDSWSLAKQSGIYFSIACVTMFPIAYITNWMKHNAIGILSYVGIFVAIFVITWLVQYFVWKRKVKRMNDGVRKSNNAK